MHRTEHQKELDAIKRLKKEIREIDRKIARCDFIVRMWEKSLIKKEKPL